MNLTTIFNHKLAYGLLNAICLMFCISSLAVAQKNVVFPEGAGVIDVTKAPYFAQGDGITDDTDAINQAMLDHPDGHFIIYLPNGTYLVSDRIEWPRVSAADTNCSTEQSCRYTILQGQNSDSTVIKLQDSAVDFQDASNRRAVLWCGQGAAQRFRNAVRDLTVNVGSGNAGASGIQFNANNQGGIFDVKVKSEDGQGVYGIDLAYTNEIGPLLVKRVEVDGFQRAVSTNFNINSMTFEDITIRNQSEFGIYVLQQVVTIRGLRSFNEVTAVRSRNQGSHLILIDSELNGTGNASNAPAIFYGSTLFARNVSTPGYRNPITFNLNGTTPVTRSEGDYVEEFVSGDVLRLCDNEEKSLNLTIMNAPEVPMEDTTMWVNVEDFGAINDKNGGDDTQAIQDAMNSGASTIYIPVNSFRNGGYTMLGDVNVPGTVTRIIGTEGGVSGTGKFILTDGDSPLIIERVRTIPGIQHDASRTLIVKSAQVRNFYSCSSGADLFLEDVQFPVATFVNQNVWARQYNIETDQTSIINDNSNLWILGFKTEKRGTKIKTINGGKTEVIGAHIYSTSAANDDFMFIVEDGSLSLAGIRETNFNSAPYQNLIRETRGGVTRELVAGQANFGINGSGFPLFVGYASTGTNTAPVVEAQNDVSVVLPLDSITLSVSVNDDGLPGNACFNNLIWSQVSGPADATITDPTSLSTNVSFPQSGDYVFEITVSDGALTSVDQVAVFVYDQLITTADHDSDGVASGNGADARVAAAGGQTLNYGGVQSVPVRNHPTIFHSKGYFRFDLSALDGDILEAGLDLEISTTNTRLIDDWTYNVFGLIESDNYGDGRLDEMWLEGTRNGEPSEANELNYSNAPGNGSSGGGVYNDSLNTGGGVDNALTQFLGTFQLEKGKREIIEFQSDALTQLLNDDTNGLVTLIITRVDANNNVISFSSKENTTFSAPALKLAFEQPADIPFIGEVGVSSTGNEWTTVTLNNNYIDPVVIMGPSSFYDEDKSTVRVRNVTTNSFEWQMDEWEYQDQLHGEEVVHYMVVESGEHILPNGTRVLAGNKPVDRKWSLIDFQNDFESTPTVFAQCASINEAQAVTTRIRNSEAGSFEVKLQEEENGGTLDGQRGHIFETVSWVAIEEGEAPGVGVEKFESSRTPNVVRHEMWYDIQFIQSYDSAERAVFAGMQTQDGGDPAVLRYNRDSSFNSFTNSGIEVFLEEELSRTTENGGLGEIKHASEVIGYVIFGGLGDIPGTTLEQGNTMSVNGVTLGNDLMIDSSIQQQNDLNNNLIIYPNPVNNGELHIAFTGNQNEEISMVITDLSGKILQTEMINENADHVVNTGSLEPGFYLIQLSIQDEIIIRKVLVE